MEEEQMIRILKNLRNEIDVACMCQLIEFPEKQQWREQVVALDWVLEEVKNGRRQFKKCIYSKRLYI